jgi:CBS domain-containing protein
MVKRMKVAELMTTGVVCVRLHSSLAEAEALMRQLRTTALPVCDNDRLAGVVTDRDLAVHAAAIAAAPARTTVREVMTRGIVFVFDDDDAPYAAHLMEERQVFRVPVLNRDHRLVGMIALADIEQRTVRDADFPAQPNLSDR